MTAGPGLADVRRGLATAAVQNADASIHHRAFVHWLNGDESQLTQIALQASAEMKSAGMRSVRDVAALAFASALGAPSSIVIESLAEGLAWLGERTWFQAQRPPTLEVDGIAVVGLALGLKATERSIPSWFSELVVRSAAKLPLSEFDRSLFIVAAHIVAAADRQDQLGVLPELRVIFSGFPGIVASEDTYRDAWHRILVAQPSEGDEIHATIFLRALELIAVHSLPMRVGKLEPSDVLTVLEGIQRSLRRWTWETEPKTRNSSAVQWDLQHEYHVQNLLYAILAPLFQDLNDEETLPPVGQKNPRVDLSIPSLRTIIEVKFVRPGDAFQKIISEVAEDVGLYKTDKRWTTLIPFIWDDSARSEEHAKLVDGLKKLDLVIGAVVVSRPGKMPLMKRRQ
jgi:hypothetical protein